MSVDPAAMTAKIDSALPEETSLPRPPHISGLFWKFSQCICRVVTTLAFDFKASGLEHVPPIGGVLVVSNHQSYLDPVLLAVKLKRPMCYMAKSELFRNPIFAKLIRGLNAFPIRKGKSDKGAIEETVRLLRQGYLLNIFPEGTRTLDGNIQPLQRGVALVARRAEVPIIPAVIEGSFRSWSKGRIIPMATAIRVAYGPPLNAAGMRPDAIMQWMDTTLNTMHAELRASMRAEGLLK